MTTLTTVVPVFNGEKYISETLQSVAAQKRRPDRVIVLDNCSTDRTRQIVERFEAIECEFRQNERNLGLFGNLNRALEFAPQTQFLHLLHADDLIKPEFYNSCLGAFESRPGRGLVFCMAEFIDENSRPVAPATKPSSLDFRELTVRDFVIARVELRPIYFPGVLLKTSGLPSPCRFRLDMPQLADHVFWAEWAVQCQSIVESGEVLCQYRVHPSSDTQRNISKLDAWVLDEWKAMQLIAPLLKERGLQRWLREQRLKSLFAARSHVKIEQVKAELPESARAIRDVVRPKVSRKHWMLGRLAVKLRRLLKPA